MTPSAAFLSTLPARGATGKSWLDYTVVIPFLSTLPARGATEGLWLTITPDQQFLSTLPARGATGQCRHEPAGRTISIHAPREGSDQAIPTLVANIPISIHAPREGSDPARRRWGS